VIPVIYSSQPSPARRIVLAVIAAHLSSAYALAGAFSGSASDSIFSPSSWSVSVRGTSANFSGGASQVMDGFSQGSNAWLSTLSPRGNAMPAWTVSIFEDFSYDPSVGGGVPDVQISFDSRWVTVAQSRVGPAVRQGTTIWAGWHGWNTSSWLSYQFSGWDSILAGTTGVTPDFSAGAAPIYFGFYQLNTGSLDNINTEFANFSVSVAVPAPAAMLSILGMVSARILPTRNRLRR
jgi:hypothetical protein